jgi:hypothetical protein
VFLYKGYKINVRVQYGPSTSARHHGLATELLNENCILIINDIASEISIGYGMK